MDIFCPFPQTTKFHLVKMIRQSFFGRLETRESVETRKINILICVCVQIINKKCELCEQTNKQRKDKKTFGWSALTHIPSPQENDESMFAPPLSNCSWVWDYFPFQFVLVLRYFWAWLMSINKKIKSWKRWKHYNIKEQRCRFKSNVKLIPVGSVKLLSFPEVDLLLLRKEGNHEPMLLSQYSCWSGEGKNCRCKSDATNNDSQLSFTNCWPSKIPLHWARTSKRCYSSLCLIVTCVFLFIVTFRLQRHWRWVWCVWRCWSTNTRGIFRSKGVFVFLFLVSWRQPT